MNELRQLVLTIHGVNSTGEWQEMVGRVLEPHFACTSITYGDYQGRTAPLRVVCDLPLAVLGAVGLILAIGSVWQGSYLAAGSSSIVGVALLGLSGLVAYFRRRRVLGRVKASIDAALKGHPERPHVIAHSFGTYLAGAGLRKFKDVKFSRMVLVGSVLPRSFGWTRILEKRERAFDEVRNEHGQNDWIAWLAGATRLVVRDLGSSGRDGFRGTPVQVHTNDDPWGLCPACKESDSTAIVHNVYLEEFGHADQLLGTNHARRLWLPFLWGYPPAEFDEYVELCWHAAYSFQEQLREDLQEFEDELLSRKWSWCAGESLREYVARRVRLEMEEAGRPTPSQQEFEMVHDEVVVSRLMWKLSGPLPVPRGASLTARKER